MHPLPSHSSFELQSVIDFHNAFGVARSPQTVEAMTPDAFALATMSSAKTIQASPQGSGSPHLGNFDAVFHYLKDTAEDHFTSTNTESPTQNSPRSEPEPEFTPPSSFSEDDAQYFEDFIKRKEVRWQDEVDAATGKGSPARKRSLRGRQDSHELNLENLRRLLASGGHWGDDDNQQSLEKSKSSPHLNRRVTRKSAIKTQLSASDFDSETDKDTSSYHTRKERKNFPSEHLQTPTKEPTIILASAKHLTPAWVTPLSTITKIIPSPSRSHSYDTSIISPIVTLTREEAKAEIAHLLRSKIGPQCLPSGDLSLALSQYGGNDDPSGIHIFVDSSNIIVGFQDTLKAHRTIPREAYVKRPPISFHSLAFIMERGRGVAKRVLVGSTDRGVLPDYMVQARRCGYEVSSLERVEKVKEESPYVKKSRRYRSGYGTSGQSSGSETGMVGVRKVAEQGVDEILHMKMLESIVDTAHPSTMVLATGDAAEAEYSSGFLRNVERALEKGWKVELVAWRASMSYSYRSKEFVEKWKGKFMVLELDDFAECLLGDYVRKIYVDESEEEQW
jgi:hypothetical protein